MFIFRRFKASIFILCALYLAAQLAAPIPAAGITLEEEEKLGREFIKVAFKHYQAVKDPLIVKYVRRVCEKIVSALPPQPFTYHFYVLNRDEYNAFASPGGHIFINSGLIEAMQNEEELAGIIAHEIAHVVSRHISQKIERGKKIGLGTLAGVVAGVFLGVAGAAAVAQAVTIGSMAAGQSMALAYSREDEMQADQLGLDYLLKAGYSGEGLLTMLQKIRSKQWYGPQQIPTYLRTHPASEDRIAYLGSWVEQHGGKTEKVPNAVFQKMHTRLVALYGDAELAQQRFAQKLKSDPSDPLAHYGYGLLLARAGRRQDAIAHFRKALEKRAFDADFLTDLGKTYYLDGQINKGLGSLQGALGINTENPESYFFLGRTQLDLGRYKAAQGTFLMLLQKEPQYDEAYYFLGETYGKQGDLGEAHYYLGLYHQKLGKIEKAQFHWKRALNHTEVPETRAKIEAALEKIRAEGYRRGKKN